MDDHAQLIQWALVAIGIGQGLILALFGLVWSRQKEITIELREEIAEMRGEVRTIWESVREHHEDVHAHGNGMPRGETLARFEAVERDVMALEHEAENWMKENRDDHRAIASRLEQILDVLMPRRKPE